MSTIAFMLYCGIVKKQFIIQTNCKAVFPPARRVDARIEFCMEMVSIDEERDENLNILLL